MTNMHELPLLNEKVRVWADIVICAAICCHRLWIFGALFMILILTPVPPKVIIRILYCDS